jgi:MFS family permease
MQAMAFSWLVFTLSGSALNLGFNIFLSALPTLLLSYQGGRLADRWSSKRVLLVTQTIALSLALVLFVVASTATLTLPMLYSFTFLQGILDALEVPSRQVIVRQTVPDKSYLVNALSLTTSLLHISRIAGPALAAMVLSLWGAPICFLINAISYLFSLFTIAKIRVAKVVSPGGMSTGFRGLVHRVWKQPFTRAMIQLYVVMGLLGLQYLVILPAFVKLHLGLAEGALGTILAFSAFGSLTASLLLASFANVRLLSKGIGFAEIGFGLSLIAFAFAPSFSLALMISLPLGLFQTFLMSGSSALLQQLISDERVRGRVLSLFVFLSMGTAAPGALLIGLLANGLGPSFALALSGAICIGVGSNFVVSTRKLDAQKVDI